MASILKVDTIQDQSGNNIINENADTITIGASGDTITIPSGATLTNNGTASGFGKVLQVVTATDSTERSTTSTSFVTASNTLSVSITPSSASNKILILVSTTIGNTSTTSFTYVTVYRGASNLGTGNGFINQRAAQSGASFSYLDSPSSTSSLTYQVYMRVEANTGYLVASGTKSSITVMEIEG